VESVQALKLNLLSHCAGDRHCSVLAFTFPFDVLGNVCTSKQEIQVARELHAWHKGDRGYNCTQSQLCELRTTSLVQEKHVASILCG
jgi:hypothetical protein